MYFSPIGGNDPLAKMIKNLSYMFTKNILQSNYCPYGENDQEFVIHVNPKYFAN